MDPEIVIGLRPTAQDLAHLAQWIGWTLLVGLPLLACVGLGRWIQAGLQSPDSDPETRPAHWDRSLEDWGDLSPEDRGLAEALRMASLRPISRGRVVDLEQRRIAMDDRITKRRQELDGLMRATSRRVH